MVEERAGLIILGIGALALWGLTRKPEEEIELEKKAKLTKEAIPGLINEAVSSMNAAREAATRQDWKTSVAEAQKAVDAAHKAEELAGTPIPNQTCPGITLGQQAESYLWGAEAQSYAAAQTSPTGYASGGYENAADFGYGAGVF